MRQALMLGAGAAALFTAQIASPAAGAQATPPAARLDVITVTAQRRSQDVQRVPLTLEVVTTADIEAVAADDLSDLDAFVPGLGVGGGSPTQPSFSIRGVSTSDFGVGTDPAVGVYVDGVYAARSGASLVAFNDVARIEVIKGPQGTLFGRNSAAGAISIVTNAPSDEVEGELSIRAGDYGKRRVEMMVNRPLADTLAARFNVVINERDGLITDAGTGEAYDRQDNVAGRLSLAWRPTAATEAILRYTYDRLDEDGRAAIGITPLPAAPGRPAYPYDPATLLNPFDAPVRNDVRDNVESRRLQEVTLDVSHDLQWASLRSISAFRYFETANRQDEDGTDRINLYFDTNNAEQNQSWYQEVRLSGSSDRFDWLAGISYYDENASQRSETRAFTDSVETALASIGVGTPFSDFETFVLRPNQLPFTLLGHEWEEIMYNSGDFSAFAVFADVEWRVTPQFALIGGVRYTRDEKTFSWLNGAREAPRLDRTLDRLDQLGVLALAGVTPADFGFDLVFDLSGVAGVPCDNAVTVAEGVRCELSDTWEDVSPRLVANWTPNDALLVFASYTQGYKAGGYNSVEVASRFDNEEVDNYEAGVKFTGETVRLSASAFHYLYQDKQAVRLVADVGGSGVPQYVVETSDETGTGVDLQIDWSPAAGLRLFADAQYIDVTFDERVTRSGLDLSGEPTGVPEWSAAAGASKAWGLADGSEIELIARHAYQGERRCNTEARGQLGCASIGGAQNGEARRRTDLRAYWTSAGERYQLGAYVNNLFDQEYVTGVNTLTADTFGTVHATISEPRLWGVDMTIRW